MAIGWLAAFKAIPWADVIAAAPTVVKGSRRLLDRMRKRSGEDEAAEKATGAGDLAARVEHLEMRMDDLQAQHRDALALVESLAEQQEKLVSAVEVLRLRSKFLLLLSAALVAALLLTRIFS